MKREKENLGDKARIRGKRCSYKCFRKVSREGAEMTSAGQMLANTKLCVCDQTMFLL